jgi:hypothetical protein
MIMADPGTPAGTRVRAADLVLKHAKDASEEDIEARLSELDRTTEGPRGNRRTFGDEDLPPFIVTVPFRPPASLAADEPSAKSRGSVPKVAA